MATREAPPYFAREKTTEQYACLDRALAKNRICTIFGPEGSGKTAMFDSWRTRQPRPDEVLYIVVDPPSDEYRSSTHMIYSRLLDAIYETTKPAYAPDRDEDDSRGERFGKKQLEVLRKKVVRALRTRPFSAIALDRAEFADHHGYSAFLQLRYGVKDGKPHPCRAVFVIGQPKPSKDVPNLLSAWINKRGDTREAWLERLDLQCPSLEEIRGTREQPGLFKKWLEEGIQVTVADTPDKPKINEGLGELVEGTRGNLSSLARLVELMDDEAEKVAGGEKRYITLATLQRVRARLGHLTSP